jgi:hypothetical protein
MICLRCFVGAVAKQAAQMGVSRADIIEDLGRGVSSLASNMGGQVGGPVADSVQVMADDIAAWMGVGQVVNSGSKALAPPVDFNNIRAGNNILPIQYDGQFTRQPSNTQSYARN